MDRSKPPLSVVPGGAQIAPSGELAKSPDVPPLAALSTNERRVWKYICDSLVEAGLEHITAGLPIMVIVRTYSDWLEAAKKCELKGRYQESANSGWASEAPWAADERRLKSELGQWLPKACLTIPSLSKVRKESGVESGQDDLFGAMAGHGRDRPASNG
ncbi:hypothetical protein [Methyloversatilis sp.]|uniref:hypothetical protein n=1 Tax=Methyloversatilis sp. TaxID=2569862 RepID=UPI0035B3FCB0